MRLDHWIAVGLIPLGIWILLSGLDDLFIALAALMTRAPFAWPSDAELDARPERRIAIYVPLWHEHLVIGRMLERNLASIRYGNFDVFVGVYSNDALTMRAVAEAAARDPRIHAAVLPHPGPTSKGDCLNWIHRRMEEHEAAAGVRFEIITTHDAEDLIHPESLRLINWFSRDYQMMQVPVLALATGLREVTHGLYCDEFAEYQQKDIPVRVRLGGFLPGNGVGTGFERSALERLAETRGGRIFDPACLTEDYENGFRLHAMGCRQLFIPVKFQRGGPVATREYFPRRLRAAVRQRSRWVTGITLQGWELHGWRVPWRQRYWFWRDRKGLVSNLLSPVANLMFVYGVAGRSVWRAIPVWAVPVCGATLIIALLQAAIRCATSARVYGWRFAWAAPLRLLWGNAVNFLATALALRQFAGAKLRRHRLVWRKTEHDYPAHAAWAGRPCLGEVLTRMKVVPLEQVEAAARNKPQGYRLGEYLIYLEQLSEDDLYEALSRQAGIPLGLPDSREVSRLATRVLPVETSRRWNVLPYRVNLGQLHVVTTDIPSVEMTHELAALSNLELRFRLVRPTEFERLAREYLPSAS